MIYVDFSLVATSCYFAQHAECGYVDIDDYRKHVVKILCDVNNKHKPKFGRMVICAEASRSWRYEIFPHYKHKRKLRNADDAVKWQQINELKTLLREELEDNNVFKVVAAQHAEGDDIIAVLARNFFEPSIIVSGDQDFHQLHSLNHVWQCNHKEKIAYKDPNPLKSLMEKVISGCSSDDIPNIHSKDSVFVEKIRQTTVSAKKKLHYLENFYIAEEAIPEEYQRNFERNQRLTNFDFIPEEIQKRILDNFSKPSEEVMFNTGARSLYLAKSGLSLNSL